MTKEKEDIMNNKRAELNDKIEEFEKNMISDSESHGISLRFEESKDHGSGEKSVNAPKPELKHFVNTAALPMSVREILQEEDEVDHEFTMLARAQKDKLIADESTFDIHGQSESDL
mmetsp:Transcript_10027/g.15242  ORF Transcript_10027/g.15242 Transcript_10027/m.15242 type:complete len:116 (+) Transcript_10027:2063-2410(+)